MVTDLGDVDDVEQVDGNVPNNPRAEPIGFGVINVESGEVVQKEEKMPFDGYIAGIDLIGWPSGANNAIGFNIRVNGSDPIVPKNYERDVNEYISADDAVGDITIIEPEMERGDTIEVEIKNGSTSSKLDLNPLVVTVTNFNPLLLSSR